MRQNAICNKANFNKMNTKKSVQLSKFISKNHKDDMTIYGYCSKSLIP